MWSLRTVPIPVVVVARGEPSPRGGLVGISRGGRENRFKETRRGFQNKAAGEFHFNRSRRRFPLPFWQIISRKNAFISTLSPVEILSLNAINHSDTPFNRNNN